MDNTGKNIIIIGTNEGVYRAPIGTINKDTVKIFDSKHVLRVHRFGDKVFAATRSGLFRSEDYGESWYNLNVPRREVYSVLQSPDGQRLYAGTHPAHLYISDEDGTSWRELTGLQDLPSRDSWRLPRHRNEAHVRSLGAHPDAPDRLIAGIEVGGVHLSEDSGETWTERRNGVHDDIHHIFILGAEEYIASTGGGLYRTRDAGRSWTRLDANLSHSYFREAFVVGNRLYAAAARWAPPSWGGKKGADAALYESTDGGETFQSVPYPGQPEDFILAWADADGGNGEVFAGTLNGRILRHGGSGWSQMGNVPSAIHSLLVI